MTTPNEELLARAKRLRHELGDSNSRLDRQCVTAMYEMEQALQSQAERIKELEAENGKLSDLWSAMKAKRDTARMESHTLRAQLADAELHTKQVERGLDKATAQLAAIRAQEPVLVVEKEPDYWSGGHFHEGSIPHIKPTKVWCLPIGTKLFTHPMPAQGANAEFVRVIQFAISQDSSASDFLNDWLHGDTDEWPEFTNAKGGKA